MQDPTCFGVTTTILIHDMIRLCWITNLIHEISVVVSLYLMKEQHFFYKPEDLIISCPYPGWTTILATALFFLLLFLHHPSVICWFLWPNDLIVQGCVALLWVLVWVVFDGEEGASIFSGCSGLAFNLHLPASLFAVSIGVFVLVLVASLELLMPSVLIYVCYMYIHR